MLHLIILKAKKKPNPRLVTIQIYLLQAYNGIKLAGGPFLW